MAHEFRDLAFSLTGATISVSTPILICFGLNTVQNSERTPMSELFNKVSLVADENKDGTDHSEWAVVYNELGLHYDVHFSSPREDLSRQHLERYLTSHSTE